MLEENDEGRGDEEGQEGIGSGGEKVLPTQNQHETPTRNPVREEVGKVLPAGQEGRGNEEMSNDTRKILSACIRGVDVTELYSPERINKVCHEFGLRKGSSLDLRTGWNFEGESHRRAAWERVHQDDPMFIIGSPPCTMFSVLQCMNPAIKGADQEAVARFREQFGKARKHV